MLGTSDPDRAARLERLSAEVQSGKYKVDAAAVSRKLVDEALRGG
jgi:anti-sigma28 factor (negative regulator of flagellin synthesis)